MTVANSHWYAHMLNTSLIPKQKVYASFLFFKFAILINIFIYLNASLLKPTLTLLFIIYKYLMNLQTHILKYHYTDTSDLLGFLLYTQYTQISLDPSPSKCSPTLLKGILFFCKIDSYVGWVFAAVTFH